MTDFTLSIYTNLLHTLQASNYNFISFENYINHNNLNTVEFTSKNTVPDSRNSNIKKVKKSEVLAQSQHTKNIILRHDVDLLPKNSLRTAQIENILGIQGTYYFRNVPKSYNETIMRRIADLGHEIGYHYEDLTLAGGIMEKAILSFEKNLEKIRKLYPVTTACMHGSPRSPWDSKDLWKEYNYRDYGIIGEPYFDINFSKVLYLTDTGRRWDGEKVSVRDKVSAEGNLTDLNKFHSTSDIIRAAENHSLPNQIMLTIHPQRWTDKPLPWVRELIMQSAKNVIKRWFFVG